jgi:hypothetical protein
MDHQQPPAVPEPSSVLCSVAVDWRGSLHANNNLRKETISTCAPKSYVLSCSFQWLLDRTVEMKIALLSLPCSSDTLPTFTPLKTKQQCYSHTLSNEVYSNLKFLCRSKDLSLSRSQLRTTAVLSLWPEMINSRARMCRVHPVECTQAFFCPFPSASVKRISLATAWGNQSW